MSNTLTAKHLQQENKTLREHLRNVIGIFDSEEYASMVSWACIHGWSCSESVSLANGEKIDAARKFIGMEGPSRGPNEVKHPEE